MEEHKTYFIPNPCQIIHSSFQCIRDRRLAFNILRFCHLFVKFLELSLIFHFHIGEKGFVEG